MNTFYYDMVWIIFSLLGIGLIITLTLLFIYLKRSAYVEKKINYMNDLFQHHFKVTDQTIVDTRKERDFWKEKALALEKKS